MEPNQMQSVEIRQRIQEYNREAGIVPIYQEKMVMQEGFLDELFDGSPKDSFAAWNLLRRSRTNILAITIDRKEGVTIEQARSSNDVKRIDGQCKDLLYGNSRDGEQAWLNVDRNVVTIKVDVREPYPTTVKSATDC